MKTKRIAIYALTIFWMIMLFYFSSQPANISNGQSGRVMMIFRQTLGISEGIVSDKALQFAIRKSGHGAGYFVLGILMTLSAAWAKGEKPRYMLALTLCFLYAVSDELHQTFVPGRSGELRDVVIDTLGASLGVLLAMQIVSKSRNNLT